MASKAASFFFFGREILSIFEKKKKVPSRTFFSHPAATPETEGFSLAQTVVAHWAKDTLTRFAQYCFLFFFFFNVLPVTSGSA